MAEKPPALYPPEVNEDQMPQIYEWVDSFNLSRPKRNIARDFADGGTQHSVLIAEILHSLYPRLVELHNYSAQNAAQGRGYNWATLNSDCHAEKVFEKMGFSLAKRAVDEVVNCTPGAIERILSLIHKKVGEWQTAGKTPTAELSSSSAPRTEYPRLLMARGEEVSKPSPSSTLQHKEEVIQELKETIEILENKLKKSEVLLKAKDARIEELTAQIERLMG